MSETSATAEEVPPPFLDAHVVVRRPTFALDVALDAEPGEVVAILGPNGSGKSTLLRALAGVQPLDAGRVTCDGRVWEAPGARRVPLRERHVGVVFQQGLLFPHLSARANVAYGLRSRGADRRSAEEAAQSWLDRLGVGELARSRPRELSGGQAQRVAIARALCVRPRLVLLDEPLSALDVGVAMTLRLELAQHLRQHDGVSLLVTHDVLDALTVATRVVVLDDGVVAQQGTPEEVARHPRTDHVARLVGLNLLRGTGAGTGTAAGAEVRLDGGEVLVTGPHRGAGPGPVHAGFPPSAVTLTRDRPSGSARNAWRGPVTSVVPHGGLVRVHVDVVGGLLADLTAASVAELGVVPGALFWTTVKAAQVVVYA